MSSKVSYDYKPHGISTEHFELMRVTRRPSRRGQGYFKLYVRNKERPGTLVEVSALFSEAEKTLTKLERLYPCHFLAKEWTIK